MAGEPTSGGEPTVLHVQPGDVLLIGNVHLDIEGADEFVAELRARLRPAKVFLFADAIDVKLLRDARCAPEQDPVGYCQASRGAP